MIRSVSDVRPLLLMLSMSVITTNGKRENIESCLDQIDLFLLTQRERAAPTHFVSLPLDSCPALVEKYNNFLKAAQSSATSVGVRLSRQPPQSELQDPTRYVPASKLHLTLAVLVLLDDADVVKAGELLKELLAARAS